MTPAEPVASASAATAETLLATCAAMELDRRLADVSTAQHMEQRAVQLGRIGLAMRFRLVTADAMIRLGDLAAARELVSGAQRWATESQDEFVLARSHFLLSIAYDVQGDWAAAAHHACLAVDGLPELVVPAVRARHLVVLALSLDQMRVGDGAPYHAEALDIAAATGDTVLSMSVFCNLVWNALDLGDTDTGWSLVTRMRRLAARTGTPLRAADLQVFALVELARDDPAAAERTLLPLLDDPPSVVLSEVMSLPSGLTVLAQAQRRQGDLERAQRTLDHAAALCEAAGLAGSALEVSEEQAQLHADAGRFREAYEEHRRLYAGSRALLSAERDAQARSTQAAFETREGRRETDRYRELALRDALTGLYNRRFVDHQLPALIEACRGHLRPVSVALVDVDFFKRVNDTLSHDVGDVVLRRIAELQAAAVDAPATAARLGGEEFLLALPDTGTPAAVEVAERLRRSIQEHDWSGLTGELPITVSIGVATTTDGRTTPGELLGRADRCLYAAKRGGRNQVVADPA